MITPSTIAKKVVVQSLPQSEYSFPEQVREDEGKKPLIAGYYTMYSMQTYSYNGQPTDSRGDNWD
jgi:hypothetical protein